jgi:hypothetical protein
MPFWPKKPTPPRADVQAVVYFSGEFNENALTWALVTRWTACASRCVPRASICAATKNNPVFQKGEKPMSIDIFNTHVLSKVVEKLERPSSFLLDVFFGQEQTEDSEEIHFDIDKSKPR